MRYRPFGRSGMAVSCVVLQVDDASLSRGPQACRSLIWAALEQGINAYHLTGTDPSLPHVVGEALSAVERRLVFVGLRLGAIGKGRDFSPEGVTRQIAAALGGSGLGYFDMAILDDPQADELPQKTLELLKDFRATEQVRNLGVAGDNPAMETYIATNAFDVLASPYNLKSGWLDRHRMRTASQKNMTVFGYDYFPSGLDNPKQVVPDPRKAVARPVHPLYGAGSYGFLHETKNWTAEEICLAYALTEPTLSAVMIEASDLTRLEQLAAVPERDLPNGLAAQIEMARFGEEKAQSKSA